MTCGTSAADDVLDLIAEQLTLPRDAVLSELRLVEDLGADQVSLTQLALWLEDLFDIEIADEEWARVSSVADVIACVDHTSAVKAGTTAGSRPAVSETLSPPPRSPT